MGFIALIQVVIAVIVLYYLLPKTARYYYIIKWHVKDDLDTASKGAVAKEHLADLRAKSEENESPSVLPCDPQSLVIGCASSAQGKAPVANQVQPESEVTVVASPVEVNVFETKDLSTPAFLRCGNGTEIMARIKAVQAKKIEPVVVEVFSHAKTAAKQVISATQLTQTETSYTYKGFGSLEPSRF